MARAVREEVEGKGKSTASHASEHNQAPDEGKGKSKASGQVEQGKSGGGESWWRETGEVTFSTTPRALASSRDRGGNSMVVRQDYAPPARGEAVSAKMRFLFSARM